MPTERPISGDQAPAAQTTVPVAIAPSVVSTATDLGSVECYPGHRAAGQHRGTVRPRTGCVPLHGRFGARVPVECAERRGEDALEAGDRAQLVGLLEIDEATRHAELVLERDARLEGDDVLLAVEQEEVTDLMQVDLGARSLAEPHERLDAAQADRDVERIGELRAEPACGTTGRAACELVALEEAYVDSGFREMECDARPDDAASDDHDLSGGGQAHRRTRFLRKNPTFAGRSASRRMRYGYQSGPNGDATSTL